MLLRAYNLIFFNKFVEPTGQNFFKYNNNGTEQGDWPVIRRVTAASIFVDRENPSNLLLRWLSGAAHEVIEEVA